MTYPYNELRILYFTFYILHFIFYINDYLFIEWDCRGVYNLYEVLVQTE